MISASSQDSVSAVSLVAPILFLSMALYCAVANGGTVVVAQYKGKGDQAQVNLAAGQTVTATVGVAAIVIVQTIENVGMCLAMLPVVGLTLPFLSCGGSSVLATYVLLSLVHSIKGHKPKMRRW